VEDIDNSGCQLECCGLACQKQFKQWLLLLEITDLESRKFRVDEWGGLASVELL
jgi:hypothetical protein